MSPVPFSLRSAIDQVENCGFDCQAGPLANNAAWQWLREHVTGGGPAFMPGQTAFFKVTATVDGTELERWVQYTIVGCTMSSNADGRTWLYSISRDPPDAYHHGGNVTHNIKESALRLAPPTEAEGARA